MNFQHFQSLLANFFEKADFWDNEPAPKYHTIDADKLPPLVLAYIGDAFFTLFVRYRLLAYEQNKVRVLHTFDSRMVSAVMQAAAIRQLENSLTEAEIALLKRGRNAKSTPAKNAPVGDYRYSTGFEALLGYLLLSENHARLLELAEGAFICIAREIVKSDENSGEKR